MNQIQIRRYGFVFGYIILMTSIIGAIFFADFNSSISPNLERESTSKRLPVETESAPPSFEEETTFESNDLLFGISNELAVFIISFGAILDVVIVIWWASRENKKTEQQSGELRHKRRWRESKWFWNIVAMGVIQPNDQRYKINWLNLIFVTLLIHTLLYMLFRD